jgi:hypothetical protein
MGDDSFRQLQTEGLVKESSLMHLDALLTAAAALPTQTTQLALSFAWILTPAIADP